MSYDIEIWSQNKLILSDLDLDDSWEILGDGFQYQSKKWLISCNANSRCEEEDIPEEILPLVPSISYLNNLSVQPIHAPKTAISKAKGIAKLIGMKTIGVVYDKQIDKILLPKGFKRYKAIKTQTEERISRLSLIWYMRESSEMTYDDLYSFLKYLERILPEALPKRYGDYEPPQFKLINQGFDHFCKFLHKSILDGESIIWYPSKPVLSITMAAGSSNNRLGVTFPYFEIEFDARILRDQSWSSLIQKLWRTISHKLNPFYGEVRFLKNAIASRTTYWCDSLTEDSPTRRGHWMGLPQVLGPAIVVGPEYEKEWKEFSNFAMTEDNLSFVECDEWNEESTILDLIGPPPKNIAQKVIPKNRKLRSGGTTMHWNTEYPEFWPFGEPPTVENQYNSIFDFVPDD